MTVPWPRPAVLDELALVAALPRAPEAPRLLVVAQIQGRMPPPPDPQDQGGLRDEAVLNDRRGKSFVSG